MKKLKLYSHPFSRGRTVRWMLEEIGAPYELEVMEFGGSIKSPEYLAINPMGKVPALVHGDTVVTETVAICAYLADQFPEKQLAPPVNSPERGSYYRWLFFTAGPLEMATTAKAFGWSIDEERAQMAGCGRLRDVHEALERALSNGPYVCGDQFSAADLVLSAYIGWEMSQNHLEGRSLFQEYVQRIASRPAAKRATELDDALGNALKASG